MADEQGQFQYIKLPDGSYGKFASDVDDATIQGAIEKDFPDAFRPSVPHATPSREQFAAQMHEVPSIDNPMKAFTGAVQGVKGIAKAIMNPQDAAASMGSPFVASGMAPGGMYPGTMNTSPDVQNSQENVQREELANQGQQAFHTMAHPFESAGAVAGPALLTHALVKGVLPAAASATRNVFDPVRPYRSPLIPPNEAIARAATDIIRPNPLEYRNTVSSLTQRMPEIKKFLADSGVNPKSPLEFAKGATGAGKQASTYFQENLIKPNAEAPAGSGTIGSVYGRLGAINDELRPIYRSRTMGEQMTKEAADHVADLENERDNLNNVLYGGLSKRTGLPVEDIRDINQRGAQLQHVGDVTDAAQATRRSGFSGYTPTGLPIPMGTVDRAMKLMSYLRGGPEASAGRKLTRVMSQVTDEPKPLPNPGDLDTHRLNYAMQEKDAAAANQARSVARKPEGMGPTQPPTATVEQGNVDRLIENIRNRRLQKVQMQEAQEATANANREAAKNEVIHSENLNNAAQDASAQRASRAQGLRQARGKLDQEAGKTYGETMRSISRLKGKQR